MCKKCNDTGKMILRLESEKDVKEVEVVCDCVIENNFRFTDPYEFLGFLDIEKKNED